MEHISKHLQVERVPEQTNSLAILKTSSALLAEEQKVIELKYVSTRFGAMAAGELSSLSKALLIKIHVITGWVVPDGDFLRAFVDQFQKKLSESYGFVNADEVEYAFREYGTTVKDWGKNMNLALIDEVMRPYLELRTAMSKMEEQKVPVREEKKEDLSDQSMQEWYDATAKQVRINEIQVEFVPLMLYEWMDRKGKITATPAQKKGYLHKAAQRVRAQLAKKALDRDSSKELMEFETMRVAGEFTGHWVETLKGLAKKMILHDHILKTE